MQANFPGRRRAITHPGWPFSGAAWRELRSGVLQALLLGELAIVTNVMTLRKMRPDLWHLNKGGLQYQGTLLELGRKLRLRKVKGLTKVRLN